MRTFHIDIYYNCQSRPFRGFDVDHVVSLASLWTELPVNIPQCRPNKKKVYPFAVRDYHVEQATVIDQNFPASGESLLVDLLVRCIAVYKVPVKRVS